MQIQPIANSYNNKYTNTNFKQRTPMIFWEKVGKKYNVVTDLKQNKDIAEIITRCANRTDSQSLAERKMVIDTLTQADHEYEMFCKEHLIPKTNCEQEMLVFEKGKDNKPTGSFCTLHRAGWIYGKFYPVATLLSGVDRNFMNHKGFKIGSTQRRGGSSADIETARENYASEGNDLVSSISEKADQMHVIVEKIGKSKEGKDLYKILKARMYPSSGPANPFVIMGYYK